jgi:threonylcarbamoyladenosine tRNA methylthiotransferase MtaB
MGRPYSPREIRESASVLRNSKDDPFLGCDIITGFPGETGENFEETYNLCNELDFAWIHAFPYSPRRGTRAFSFPCQVPKGESAKRMERLMELSRRGRRAYVERWIGKTVDAVMERKTVPFSKLITDNYLRLQVPESEGGDNPPDLGASNQVRCRIVEYVDSGFVDALGEMVVY